DQKKQAFLSLVRLASVKHAASVHPDPGSNSLIKVSSSFADYMPFFYTDLALCSFIITIKGILGISLKQFVFDYSVFNVQVAVSTTA
ncbi:MAG: hypothetical protein IJS61_00040, partial [Firmicutes bacterium]|nr:hypothetical protein [Bacillota bacterium]